MKFLSELCCQSCFRHGMGEDHVVGLPLRGYCLNKSPYYYLSNLNSPMEERQDSVALRDLCIVEKNILLKH